MGFPSYPDMMDATPQLASARVGCAGFRVGSRQLHIGAESLFYAAKKAHPTFSVSDIDTLFATLTDEGLQCVWDEALRCFYASDPSGNRLEFTEPSSRLT